MKKIQYKHVQFRSGAPGAALDGGPSLGVSWEKHAARHSCVGAAEETSKWQRTQRTTTIGGPF